MAGMNVQGASDTESNHIVFAVRDAYGRLLLTLTTAASLPVQRASFLVLALSCHDENAAGMVLLMARFLSDNFTRANHACLTFAYVFSARVRYNNFNDSQYIFFPLGCFLTISGVAALAFKYHRFGLLLCFSPCVFYVSALFLSLALCVSACVRACVRVSNA